MQTVWGSSEIDSHRKRNGEQARDGDLLPSR